MLIDINTKVKFSGRGEVSMPLWSLSVGKGDLIEVFMGESAGLGGDTDYVCSILLINELTFETFELNRPFIGKVVHMEDDYSPYVSSENLATDFIQTIKSRGSINLQFWTAVPA